MVLIGTQHSLIDVLEPLAVDNGFELVRVRITGSKTKTLQVMAERPDKSMTAEDCAILSRAISTYLGEADPIEGQFILEVSSPGIDRPLTRLKDFHDWQGYRGKIELNRLVEGRKRFSGIFGGLEDDQIVLDVDGEEDAVLFPFDWLASAKLDLTDDLIAASLRAAKASSKNADSLQQTEDIEGQRSHHGLNQADGESSSSEPKRVD
ncbi:MAG: ribosome maturation factor RimP [Pseudomonadota bacterium]